MRARGAARARSQPPRGTPRDAPTRRPRPRATSAACGRSHRSTTRTCTWAEPAITPSSAARATSRRRRLRGALPCETRQVVAPAASRIQSEPAAAGASSTSRASASSAATDRRKLGELLARERAPEDRERRGLGRQPELVGRGRDRGPRLARLEPVLDRDRDDRVAEEVERSSLAPAVGQAPRPHLAGTKRGTQVAWKERCAVDRGSPAPIAAARAISSEARVAPPGTTPGPPQLPQFPQLPLCVQSTVEQWDPRPNRRSAS